jgi:hypothetical protein
MADATKSGGRKAKRAYAAQPYLGPRDAGFYGLLWTSGLLAYGGGASATGMAGGGLVWAAWLFLGWASSRWLRGAEDFDSPLADVLARPGAGLALGLGLPILGALGGLAVTGGRAWWEPLSAAGLMGMAAAAPVAFLERSFAFGSLWALVALLGGLGHPAPPAALLLPAAGLGLWYLIVTAAQAKAFRHFPEGPAPEARHLASDLLLPAGVLLGTALAAWAWTPRLHPKPVQMLPQISINVWMPGEGRNHAPFRLFGPPRMDAGGGPMAEPSASSEVLAKLVGSALNHLPLAGALLAVVAAALGGWFWWRKRKREAETALSPEARRRQILRGAGVSPRKPPALSPPADAREAVVYYYNRLRTDLSSLGIPRQEALTPAEYAQALVGHPQAGDAPIDEMTELFHRAEYSSHAMGEEARTRAATCYQRTLTRISEKRP